MLMRGDQNTVLNRPTPRTPPSDASTVVAAKLPFANRRNNVQNAASVSKRKPRSPSQP